MDELPRLAKYKEASWPENLPSYSKIYATESNGTLVWDVIEEDAKFFEGAFHTLESYFWDSQETTECETSLRQFKIIRSTSYTLPCKKDEKFEVFKLEGANGSFIGHCTYHRSEFTGEVDGKFTFSSKPIDPQWMCRASGKIFGNDQDPVSKRVAIYFPLSLLGNIPVVGL